MKIGPVSRLLRIALLTLMLGAQLLAHAHATDHPAPTGKTQCPVCAIAQPNGQAAVDTGSETSDPSPCPPQFAAGAPSAGAALPPPSHARAPPATL